MMTNDRIIEIRDNLLPGQGEPFDCLAFGLAVAKEAIRQECERCARLIEGYPHWLGDRAKAEIAAAIRAGGKP